MIGNREPRNKAPLGKEGAVGGEHVQVRVEVDQMAEGLHNRHFESAAPALSSR